jgi:hypothetical protein
MKKLNKIYEILKSCNTLSQFYNAFDLLKTYSINRGNNIEEVLLLSEIQDYSILKHKNLFLETIFLNDF